VEIPGMTFKSEESSNLLSQWESRLNTMKIGDKFKWKNNEVSYVMPYHVKIEYDKLN
jgi:hypothetical protein